MVCSPLGHGSFRSIAFGELVVGDRDGGRATEARKSSTAYRRGVCFDRTILYRETPLP